MSGGNYSKRHRSVFSQEFIYFLMYRFGVAQIHFMWKYNLQQTDIKKKCYFTTLKIEIEKD